MKIFKPRQFMWILLAASLASISQPTHAEWIGKGKEIDYFARELSVPPRIGLLENSHPVTHELVGKALYFNFDVFYPDESKHIVIHFNTDKSMTWWNTDAPEKSSTASYVVLEIAKNIYYLNFAVDKVYGLPYQGAWLAAIVVDLNKMVASDTFVSPTPNEGKPRYQLTQARIAVEDIAKAKGNTRYFPRGLLISNEP